MRITESVPDDASSWENYRPDERGGPLHLINTTINETIDGQSQIEQRDRKGLPLVVGPLGISVGTRHHALWSAQPAQAPGRTRLRRRAAQPLAPAGGFRVFAAGSEDGTIEVEKLSLGDWVGISAFTPGIGYRTSLALSLLAGMGNVRLGYWWDSGVNPADRTAQTPPKFLQRLVRGFPVFPVQRLLLRELLAQFPGTAQRRWYLSDGGHFENTAAYELVRRRLPLIILLDNGADPECMLEDLGNLVRKARLDFQTEIVFAGEEREARAAKIVEAFASLIGPLAQLRPVRSAGPFAARHLAAAAIHYPDGTRGLLLVVKPNLLGDEPSDVLQYWANHPSFPQEPTSDQFFDEAQWESYRRLGEHTGEDLCRLLATLEKTSPPFSPDAVLA
jgi:hypothetical protein